MENENPKAKKYFIRFVGIAAAAAIVFLGVTGAKPTTFLGGVDQNNVVVSSSRLSTLKISPTATTATKGQSFSVNVVLHVGQQMPQDLDIKISYDKNVVLPVYVDTLSAAFTGVLQHYSINQDGSVRISGALSGADLHEGQDLVVGKMYVRALQNIGATKLVIEKNGSKVLDNEGNNLLGETGDAQVTVTIQ